MKTFQFHNIDNSIVLYLHFNGLKEPKAKVSSKVPKSPTTDDSGSEEPTELLPEKSMDTDEPLLTESDKPTEPNSEEHKSPSEDTKPPKAVSAKKTTTSEKAQKKPSLTEHDVEILDLKPKKVEVIEKYRVRYRY